MYFEVLGPLRVGGRHPVHVEAAKQRSLLANLIRHAGQTVQVGTLTYSLWGDEPPSAPRKALGWHVRQIRALLDDPDRITWRHNGYRLTAEPDEIDAVLFERLRRRAAAAAADGDAHTAARLCAEALALWRGEAYGDVDDHTVSSEEAPRLNGLRLDTLSARIAADLDLGRHRELVGELAGLISSHPLDERLRAQYMLALHRSGRRADALEAYREGRRLLIGELGLEPGPELRAMERLVLGAPPEQPAAPVPAPRPPAEPAARVPAELPAAPRGFSGREDEVRAVLAGLAGPAAVVAVAGPGGIGKSALALHTAHLVAPRYADGRLYVNLHGTTPDVKTVTPEEALARMLRSLTGNTPQPGLDSGELSARFRSATAGRRLLIVLDDAADTAHVRDLLPAEPGCAVIVTGRRVLSSLDDAVLLRLDTLPADEALALLTRLVGTARIGAEPEAAARITGFCAGLPLALCVAAARLRARPSAPLSGLADRLAAENARLRELEVDDRAVRTSVGVSHDDLLAETDGYAAARLFQLVGLPSGPTITAPAAAALADVPVDVAAGLLDRLGSAQLIEDAAGGRLRLHDLVRLYARERAALDLSPEERAAALHRMVCYYVGAGRQVGRVFEPTAAVRWDWEVSPEEREDPAPPTDRRTALAWIAAEYDDVLALVGQAADSGPETAAFGARLAMMMKLPLHNAKNWAALLAVSGEGVRAAERSGRPEYIARACKDNAEVLLSLERTEEAMARLHQALDAARRVENDPIDGAIHGVLGAAYRRLGDVEAAKASFTSGIASARRNGMAQTEAASLIERGFLERQTGDLAASLASQQAAAAIAERLGSPHGIAITCGAIGDLLLATGRGAEAVEVYVRAVAKNKESGQADAPVAADYHWGLAEARYATGDTAGARESWLRAAGLLRDLNLIDETEYAAIAAAEHPAPPAMVAFRDRP